MVHLRSRRLAALIMTVTALSAGATVVVAQPAQASLLGGLLPGSSTGTSQTGLLGGLLPNLGTIITTTGQLLGNLLPIPGLSSIITGVTGTVGGVVGGVQATVTGVVDQTLGGVVGGSSTGVLPDLALNNLLGTLLGNSIAKPGTPGFGGPNSGGPIVLSGGQVSPAGVVLDASAPRTTVKVLSKLKAIGRNGKMQLEIRTNEPGIVAVAGNLRPGYAMKMSAAKKKAAKHSRRLIKVPSIVLGYRQAGKLVVTVKLSRDAQRSLGTSKDARMSVGTVASDVFKNQNSESTRVNIAR
jgi:hypothetical protein